MEARLVTVLLGVLATSVGLTACGTFRHRGGDEPESKGGAQAQKEAEETTPEAQLAQLKNLLAASNSRIETLEQKLTQTEMRLTQATEKLESTRVAVDGLVAGQAIASGRTAVAAPHPAHERGAPVEVPAPEGDPQKGYVNDGATQSYRQALILFEAQKYPDAILAFSSFLERYADHALAGSAQFYVGESYLRQNEYKLAIQEFRRVLTSYDRSPRITDTLRQLAVAQDMLKLKEEAARNRQTLTTLFPQSPASQNLARNMATGAATATAPAAKPVSNPASATSPAYDSSLDEIPPTAPATSGKGKE